MKKLLASIALTCVTMMAIPDIAIAENDDCVTIILCDNYVTVCKGDDITDWVSILCDENDN